MYTTNNYPESPGFHTGSIGGWGFLVHVLRLFKVHQFLLVTFEQALKETPNVWEGELKLEPEGRGYV